MASKTCIDFFVSYLIDKYRDYPDPFSVRHLAIFFDNSGNILADGTNSNRSVVRGCTYNRHAEIDALLKLPPSEKRKKIDMLVIRISKTEKMGNSKPCFICLKYIAGLYNYIVKNIYYSEPSGEIIKKSFMELYLSDTHHTTHRFRK